MATYDEIEELHDWFIDLCGEILARLDALDGDEPVSVLTQLGLDTGNMHQCGLKVIANLDELLIQKKRTDETNC